jgi:DNA-binding response OmpR family regulator
MAADNAETGLDIAASALPDVMVMDIQLPNKDGLTALCEIHDKLAIHETPVVILSACSSDRRHAIELGARYFVDKPFDSKMMLAGIQGSLGEPSQPTAAMKFHY